MTRKTKKFGRDVTLTAFVLTFPTLVRNSRVAHTQTLSTHTLDFSLEKNLDFTCPKLGLSLTKGLSSHVHAPSSVPFKMATKMTNRVDGMG